MFVHSFFVLYCIIFLLVWYWHWWQGLWKFYGIKDHKKKNVKEKKKKTYRDIYCYHDIEWVISWYKILVISPTPNVYYKTWHSPLFSCLICTSDKGLKEEYNLIIQIYHWKIIWSSEIIYLPLKTLSVYQCHAGDGTQLQLGMKLYCNFCSCYNCFRN